MTDPSAVKQRRLRGHRSATLRSSITLAQGRSRLTRKLSTGLPTGSVDNHNSIQSRVDASTDQRQLASKLLFEAVHLCRTMCSPRLHLTVDGFEHTQLVDLSPEVLNHEQN